MLPHGLKRRLLLVSSTALVLALLTACSKQSEGERCDFAVAGNSDCESGLVCRKADEDRCCPPPGARVTDARCNRTPAMGTAGGGNNGGGNNGGGSNGGGSNGGGSNGGTGAAEGGAPAAGGASAGEGGDSTEPDATSGAGGAE